MDTLEPWTMFTNDLVDGDEVIIDSGNTNGESPTAVEGNQENDVVVETEVFSTPMVTENPSRSSPIVEENKSNVNDEAIFDFIFNMEGTNSSKCPTTIEYADDMHINFEAYVVYVCPACGAEFDVQDSWKRHMISSHNFNTLSGLNFLQMDRYNHECLYCHKEIAVHNKENLFKHTFRHLPYRCTKCKFCFRQYKNPQDLILHLRMIHRDNVLEIVKAAPENPTAFASETNVSESDQTLSSSEAMDVKKTADNLNETTLEDDVEVKNELIEPDDNEYILPSFLDDALSRRSAKPQADNSEAHHEGVFSENLIQCVCPVCDMDFPTQAQWLSHIEKLHFYGTLRGLNFQKVPSENSPYFLCLECQMPIYTKSVRELQFHKFTHLPQTMDEKNCTTTVDCGTDELTAAPLWTVNTEIILIDVMRKHYKNIPFKNQSPFWRNVQIEVRNHPDYPYEQEFSWDNLKFKWNQMVNTYRKTFTRTEAKGHGHVPKWVHFRDMDEIVHRGKIENPVEHPIQSLMKLSPCRKEGPISPKKRLKAKLTKNTTNLKKYDAAQSPPCRKDVISPQKRLQAKLNQLAIVSKKYDPATLIKVEKLIDVALLMG